MQFPFGNPMTPEEQAARQAQLDRGRELYESNFGDGAGYGAIYRRQAGMLEFSDEDQAALRAYNKSQESKKSSRPAGRFARGFLNAVGGKSKLVKDFKGYLAKQGFSEQESLNFFKALDDDPTEFFGKKMPSETGEQIRFLKEYFKEAQDLYQASADVEKEMVREEKSSREQAEFDKAQQEAFGLSEEQQGELADRQRKKQQSQQYLQSRGGMTSREAQKSGMVMIPQARPA